MVIVNPDTDIVEVHIPGPQGQGVDKNIKTYGAIGDGSSHTITSVYGTLAAALILNPSWVSVAGLAAGDEVDYAALQAALNDFASWNTLIVAKGVYRINKTLTVPQIIGKHLFGAGRHDQCVIRQMTGNIPILKVNVRDTHSVNLENVTLEYNTQQTSSDTAAANLQFTDPSGPANGWYRWTFRNVLFDKGYDCIQLTGASSTAVLWGSSFENCTFSRPAHSAVFLVPSVAAEAPELRFSGCNVFAGAAYSGPVPTGPAFRLFGCEAVFDMIGIEGWDERAFWVDGGGTCVVNGLHIESNIWTQTFATTIYNQGVEMVINGASVSGTNNATGSYIRMFNLGVGAKVWLKGWTNAVTNGTSSTAMMTDGIASDAFIEMDGVTSEGSGTVDIPYNAGFVAATLGRRIRFPRVPGVALTYGATVNTDAQAAETFYLNVTNGTAFTIANPTNKFAGLDITYEIKNSSGGAMGAVTWGADFLLAGAFVAPANTKRRMYSFRHDGTNWVEQWRSAADI